MDYLGERHYKGLGIVYSVEVLDYALSHLAGSSLGRFDAFYRVVGIIFDVIERRDIDALDLRGPDQKLVLAPAGLLCFAQETQQFVVDLLTLADHKKIEELKRKAKSIIGEMFAEYLPDYYCFEGSELKEIVDTAMTQEAVTDKIAEIRSRSDASGSAEDSNTVSEGNVPRGSGIDVPEISEPEPEEITEKEPYEEFDSDEETDEDDENDSYDEES